MAKQVWPDDNASNLLDFMTCTESIDTEAVSYLSIACVLYGSLLIVMLCFQYKRKSPKCKDCCNGRPALCYPVNLLERNLDRMPFIMAFQGTAALIINIIAGTIATKLSVAAVSSDSMSTKAILNVLNCVFVGLLFYPIFAILEHQTKLNYLLGTPYVWILGAYLCYSNVPCGAFKFFLFLPLVIPFLYLGILFPLRGLSPNWVKKERTTHENWTIYVNRMLRNDYSENLKYGKCQQLFRRIFPYYPGFKFSLAFLVAVNLAAVMVYQIGLQLVYWVLVAEAYSGRTSSSESAQTSETLTVAVPSLIVTLFISISNLIFLVRGYRDDCIAVARGTHPKLHDMKTRNPQNIVILYGSYIGYQVAFSLWGFLCTYIVLYLVFLGIRKAALDFFYNAGGNVIQPVIGVIVFIVVVVLLRVAQMVIIRKACLQRVDDKPILAIDNRYFFYIFTYFLIFINMAVGLVTSLMRVILATIFAMWSFARLDMCSLSRSFEWADQGYWSYLSFLAVQNTFCNPCMRAFVMVLLDDTLTVDKTEPDFHTEEGTISVKSHQPNRGKLARNRWFLAITLTRNKSLKKQRKAYLHANRAYVTTYQ